MNVEIRTASNGCRVLFRETPYKQILSMATYLLRGSRDDAPENAGLSNLANRMLVKGTRRHSAVEIAETMEGIGGSIDVMCAPDYMMLETQTVADDWASALDILTECLFESNFPAAPFEQERKLVQTEILRAQDNKFPFTYRAFQRLFYRGHLYERPSDGEIEAIQKLDREQAMQCYEQTVRPDTMLLVVVGNVPRDAFMDQIEKNWPTRPDAAPAPRPEAHTDPGDGAGESIELQREFEQGFVIAGYKAPPVGTEASTALRLGCGILGEGMSSRLFSRLRDRDHLAYSVASSLVSRQLAAHVLLHIGTGPETVNQGRDGLLREAHALTTEPPTPEEIERARRYILGKFLVGRQTNSSLAHSMGMAEIFGLGWDWPERFPERIQAITPSQISSAVETWLQKPAIVVLRPKK